MQAKLLSGTPEYWQARSQYKTCMAMEYYKNKELLPRCLFLFSKSVYLKNNNRKYRTPLWILWVHLVAAINFFHFRGISRLPSAFVFLRWFALAHISVQVCTFHGGCKQGIGPQIFNRKSISRKITHSQSWKLQTKLTGEKLKGWSNSREKQTQDYNRNFVIQAHKS